MDKEKLRIILMLHRQWLLGESWGIKADLSNADLRGADLMSADLRGADLSNADLRGADLRGADLYGVDLSNADLRGADLYNADLRYAYLYNADLRYADLSNTKGLHKQSDYLKQFDKDDKGIIVFKAVGNTNYEIPDYWVIKEGSFIEENVNPCRTVECGCGVNFATLEWVKANYQNSVIWKCRIRFEDLSDIVVPYNTDGKARCTRLELLEVIDKA